MITLWLGIIKTFHLGALLFQNEVNHKLCIHYFSHVLHFEFLYTYTMVIRFFPYESYKHGCDICLLFGRDSIKNGLNPFRITFKSQKVWLGFKLIVNGSKFFVIRDTKINIWLILNNYKFFLFPRKLIFTN